ncbi:TetR/AcrR family transcriptional regulator [Denitrobaculum tricleocarpae]|uniref:TetR/AcrR family transcriptional regulator n=1 Tax=Denitrobaculum tricleocarpae TaxID=2591009 RepID=A0A545TKQ6_9PROT|nr:TetR/AcrR family transcriptional regulator [Denitrobaculum tricleocarpae]TQV77809.1 TetR/AcrR family transcriptional regulator [Denitrobaculum tricleocarpae]
MGRHQEFDADEVLEAAMWVFWEKGYRATSMVDLEAATGLQPGSIYNAFGSKKDLFLSVLDFYREQVVGQRVWVLLQTADPLEAIEAFFRTAYEDLEPEQLAGCLLTNSATEMAKADKDIQACVAAGVIQIETAFQERLIEAQAAGELSPDKDPALLAAHLNACFQGFGVVGRLTRDKARLGAICDAAMLCLR